MWVGTSTDIHEIKELEKQKDYFISVASHELKTPVTSIKGHVQLLQEQLLQSGDALVQQSLKALDRQVNKLNRLIADLLDITRIQSGRFTINKQPFILNDLVTETVDDIKTLSRTHVIEVANTSPQWVLADRQRIGQVISNLLTNAVKYSPDADKIKVQLTASQQKVTVAIQDFGIGIEPSEQQKIFQNFYRVRGKDEQTFSGFGIGLFIVGEILKPHNGTVWVQSEKNKGAVFYFSLPLCQQPVK
jgi:signal transduction histidine kinase